MLKFLTQIKIFEFALLGMLARLCEVHRWILSLDKMTNINFLLHFNISKGHLIAGLLHDGTFILFYHDAQSLSYLERNDRIFPYLQNSRSSSTTRKNSRK
jgi:hypothetical protein